jgi:uncharacterized LabA/DUF88 family protein
VNLGTGRQLSRIAIFIDGNYFYNVSNFYKFQHYRGKRLSIVGLQNFVRSEVADRMSLDQASCQIVEAHYFRGRYSAYSADEASKLKDDRIFDDVLTKAGVIQHYTLLDEGGPVIQEKGIDVWLALEAYDLAVHNRYDILCMVAGDGDYVPLVRKINGLGLRVLLLAWDLLFPPNEETTGRRPRDIRASAQLIDACTDPIMMNSLIEDRARKDSILINGLFY